MTKYLNTGTPRVKLYISENFEWQNALSLQSSEIPKLENILSGAAMSSAFDLDGINGEPGLLREQLFTQKMEMKELCVELDVQQWRLENDSKNNAIYNIQVLCTQDILRERIKQVEERYEELKCNLVRYLPADS